MDGRGYSSLPPTNSGPTLRVVYTVTINCDKKIITLIKYTERLMLLVTSFIVVHFSK